MRRYYIVKEGNGDILNVYQNWVDRFLDMGKWGWNAIRFHNTDTGNVIWIRKYWIIDVEEIPAPKKK